MTNLPRFIVLTIVLLAALGCSRHASVEERLKAAAEHEAAGKLPNAIIELKNVLQDQPELGAARLAMGRIYLSLGDTKAAIKELDKALEVDSNNAEARTLRLRADLKGENFRRVLKELEKPSKGMDAATVASLLGSAHLGMGDIEQATKEFSEALKLQPKAADPALGLAQIDLLRGERASALSRVTDVLAGDPKNIEALVERGKLELLDGKLDVARKTFDEAVRLAPYRASAHLGRATAMLAAGDAAAAEKSARRAGDLVPSSATAAYLYAFALYKQGREDETLRILYNLMKVYPGHPQCHLLAGEILFHKGQIHQAEDVLIPSVTRYPGYLPTSIMLAMVQLKQGNATGVIERLTALERAGIKSQEMFSLLGSAYLQIKDFESARRSLQAAAGMIEDPSQARIFSARSHLATGNPELAVNDLEKALAANPELTQADAMLILAYLARGDHAKALPLAEALVKKQPDSPQATELLGRVHDAAGRTAEARSYYEKTLSLDETYVPAALRLAELDYLDGNIAAVEERFDKFEKKPLPNAGLAAVLLSKAKLARMRNDSAADEALLRASLEKSPDSVDALLELARIAAQKGAYDEARGYLDRARESNPTAVKPRTILARLLIKNGDASGALAAAQEAYRLDKNDADVLYTLGEAYRAADKPSEAVKAYRAAIDQGVTDIDVFLGYAAAASSLGDSEARARAMAAALDAAEAALRQSTSKQAARPDQLLALGRLELLRGRADQAMGLATQLQHDFASNPEGYELEGDCLLAKDEKNAASAAKAYRNAVDRGAGRATVDKLARLYLATGTGDAVPLLQAWLDKHGDDSALRARLAEALLRNGDKDGAIKQLEKLATDNPQDGAILNNLAALYLEVSHPKALETAERAARLLPDSAAVKDTYGWALVSNRSLEKGLNLLRQAATELPEEPSVLYHYANALLNSGDRAGAAKVVRKISELNKDFPEKAKAEKLAEQLR